MRLLTTTAAAICFVIIAGCASTAVVEPVDAKAHQIEQVCIVKNPKAEVADLVEVLRVGFTRHNIRTATYEKSQLPTSCDYTLTYIARQEWDFATFMSYAQLQIHHGGSVIASAEYNHSGFDTEKWSRTATKIDPLVDELLAGFPMPPTSAGLSGTGPARPLDQTNDVYTQLLKLDELRQKGVITQQEFDEQEKKVLSGN